MAVSDVHKIEYVKIEDALRRADEHYAFVILGQIGESKSFAGALMNPQYWILSAVHSLLQGLSTDTIEHELSQARDLGSNLDDFKEIGAAALAAKERKRLLFFIRLPLLERVREKNNRQRRESYDKMIETFNL